MAQYWLWPWEKKPKLNAPLDTNDYFFITAQYQLDSITKRTEPNLNEPNLELLASSLFWLQP